MDGPTATKAIRKLGYTGRIFGVTGNGMAADVQQFTDSGVERVLIKPFTLLEFQAALMSRPGSVSSSPTPGARDSSVDSRYDSRHANGDRSRNVQDTAHRHAYTSSQQSPAYVRTVLVVEDNSMNRKMLVKLFNSVGQAVEEARNGLDAVDMVKQRMALQLPPYDAILMDFVMVSAVAAVRRYLSSV